MTFIPIALKIFVFYFICAALEKFIDEATCVYSVLFCSRAKASKLLSLLIFI